jgi:serine/threonine-protein kinase
MSAPPTPLLKLASGGSATVWLARAADGALVAVKRPHPHLFDEPGFATALAREASIAARLRHPHLVSVRGLSGEGADTALVMEYVEGCSLATLIRAWREQAPRATAGAAITIVLAVADALAAVHGARGEDGEPLGLVHRDVSPENVLVALDGGVKLIDFGLARSVGRGDRSTTGGVLKGKAGYLAPEYVRGAPIDHRIDLFALGIVLFEALTRQRLFLGENEADTLQRVLAARVPKLAEAGIDLGDASARLDAVLARALARAPADRYFEAAELATELRAAAEGMELGARAVAGAIGGEAREEIEGRRARIGRGVEKRTRRGWGWGLAHG